MNVGAHSNVKQDGDQAWSVAKHFKWHVSDVNDGLGINAGDILVSCFAELVIFAKFHDSPVLECPKIKSKSIK